MALEEYPKITKSFGWTIWPANNWSEFQIPGFLNLYFLCVLGINCCFYDFRLMNFRMPWKLLVLKDFSFRHFCSDSVKHLLYLCKSFFKFFVYFHVYIQINIFACVTTIKMLHDHSLVMFSRKHPPYLQVL